MRNSTCIIGGTLITWLIVLSISAIIGAICWPYSIHTIGLFFGKQIVIEWWKGSLLGFVPYIGQFSIPVAILTWILSLFLL